MVFAVHFIDAVAAGATGGARSTGLMHGLSAVCNAGVDLFFVLSGYLIYGAVLFSSATYWQFLSRRVRRIYPTFVAVLALYLGLCVLVPQYSKLPAEWGAALLYIGSNLLLLPGMLPITPLITVAWSLSYEMFFYLVTPLLLAASGMRRWTARARVLTWLVLWLAVLASAHWLAGYARMGSFIAGILLFEIVASNRAWRVPGTVVLLCAIALVAAHALVPRGDTGFVVRLAVTGVAFGVLCLCCIADPGGWVSRCFSAAPLRRLGMVSYSFYLLHGLVVKAVFSAESALGLARMLGGFRLPLMFVASLAMAGLTAVMLYRWVEWPSSIRPLTRRHTRAMGERPAGCAP